MLSCSFAHMAKRPLVDFLIELGKSEELRREFNDDEKREKMLNKRGLKGHKALRRGATLEEVKAAVFAEDPNAQIEWWILVDRAPIPNT
jgi:hypothetical protein